MRNLLEAELLESLAEFSRALPEHNVENIRELFQVGEYGVGLEDLCTQLYEHSIQLTPGQYGKLVALGEQMGLNKETWETLGSLVAE